MTKKEALDDIVYDLKMKGSVDFEVDDSESCSAGKLTNGGYVIESQFRHIEVNSITAFRKEVSKMGRKLVLM